MTENEQVVANFVTNYWTDDKVRDVFKFNSEGKMRPSNACSCFIGVSSSEVLHEDRIANHTHYQEYRNKMGSEANWAEHCYMALHHPRRSLDTILRAEMERRGITAEAPACAPSTKKLAPDADVAAEEPGVYIDMPPVKVRETVGG